MMKYIEFYYINIGSLDLDALVRELYGLTKEEIKIVVRGRKVKEDNPNKIDQSAMEKNENFKSDIFNNIDQTYIVKLVGGENTSKESFWVIDEINNSYYIGRGLVIENLEKIENLKNNQQEYWALIQDVVWGGKWKDKPVREVKMISRDKFSCENFKLALLIYWRIKFQILEYEEKEDELMDSIHDLQKNQLIQNSLPEIGFRAKLKELENYEKECKARVERWTEELSKIKSYLNLFKGWKDIVIVLEKNV
jgi:hypothetical protein